MMLYKLLGVSRSRLIPKVGLVAYHTRYAHLGAVRRFVRLRLEL